MPHSTPMDPAKSALRIVLLYAIVGILWIVFSDQVLLLLSPNQDVYPLFQTLKGGFYVAVTSVLLFFLVSRELRRSAALTADRKALSNELDHRVRNNLQVALSLVSIERRNDDDAVASGLAAVGNQLRALATAHDLSQREGSRGLVPVGDYLYSVLRTFDGVLEPQQREQLNKFSVSVDQAIPLGLLITELRGASANAAPTMIAWQSGPADGIEPLSLVLQVSVPMDGARPRHTELVQACLSQLSGSIIEKEAVEIEIRMAVRTQL